MFDRYMLVEDTLKNWSGEGGGGFQVNIRFPHHCGIWVSIIEEIELLVDDVAVPPEALSLTIHGNEYFLKDLEHEKEDRWNFGEVGLLKVHYQKLPPGDYKLELKIGLRVSFLEWLLTGTDKKTMTVHQ